MSPRFLLMSDTRFHLNWMYLSPFAGHPVIFFFIFPLLPFSFPFSGDTILSSISL